MALLETLAQRRVPPVITDVVLAVLLTVGCLAFTGEAPNAAPLRPLDTVGIFLVVLSAMPLAAHRLQPLPVLLLMTAAIFLLSERHYIQPVVGHWGPSIGITYVGLTIGVFLTARRSNARTASWLMSALIPVTAAAQLILVPQHRIESATTVLVVLTAAWALGRLFTARRRLSEEALRRAAAVEREQTANERAAIAEERTRIARELHDIVAHNVSLIVVQAIAADRLQDRDPDKTHEMHKSIEETGRATVTELRRLLEVLRTDEEGVERGPHREPPQPIIEAIPELVASVRRAGLQVEMTITGETRPLPAGSELTAYRIVQEALTNTLKHAGRTRTRLGISWEESPAQLVLRICDDGRQPEGGSLVEPAGGKGTGTGTGGGHGLVGMKERITGVGGSLSSGARPDGGFCVHATIPLAPATDSLAPATDPVSPATEE